MTIYSLDVLLFLLNLYSKCIAQLLSHVWLFATPWTVALQAPLPMGFSGQEYWSGMPLPSWGDLPNPRTEPASLMSPALAGGFFTTSATWEAYSRVICFFSHYIDLYTHAYVHVISHIYIFIHKNFIYINKYIQIQFKCEITKKIQCESYFFFWYLPFHPLMSILNQ